MRRRSKKQQPKHAAVRAEQTLAKAIREAKEQPPRTIAPALPAATPLVRARRGKRK